MDAAPIQIFRLVASEYKKVSDKTVNQWISLSAPLVNKKRFGTLYNQALALLTAHRMKVANVGVETGDDPLDDVGRIGVGNLMRVGNYSEGGTSLGFNTSIGQYGITDAELALTPYGVQFLSIRRMRVMSITSAGENRGGI